MARPSLLTAVFLLACVALASSTDPFKCPKIKGQEACNDEDECSWCVSRSVGTGCYPSKVIKMLPKKYFDCDKEPVEASFATQVVMAKAAAVQRIARLRGDDCDNRSEGDCISPGCVWCTSAAVGGSCYTPEQAKLLPSAIFKCKTAPSV